MSSLAEQIKELQLKLQAIQEAEVAAFQPTGSDAVGSIASTDAPPAPEPVPQSAGEQIPTIEAPTFSQAYAQAKKQGLTKFKWCGVYAVKDKVRPQPVPPRPKPANDTIPYGNANIVDPNRKYDVKNDWKGRMQAGVAGLI